MRRKHRLALAQLRTQLLQLQGMQRSRRLLVVAMSLRPPLPSREDAHLPLALRGQLRLRCRQPALKILLLRLDSFSVFAVLL